MWNHQTVESDMEDYFIKLNALQCSRNSVIPLSSIVNYFSSYVCVLLSVFLDAIQYTKAQGQLIITCSINKIAVVEGEISII